MLESRFECRLESVDSKPSLSETTLVHVISQTHENVALYRKYLFKYGNSSRFVYLCVERIHFRADRKQIFVYRTNSLPSREIDIKRSWTPPKYIFQCPYIWLSSGNQINEWFSRPGTWFFVVIFQQSEFVRLAKTFYIFQVLRPRNEPAVRGAICSRMERCGWACIVEELHTGFACVDSWLPRLKSSPKRIGHGAQRSARNRPERVGVSCHRRSEQEDASRQGPQILTNVHGLYV